jgi:heptosyltransferase-3
MRRILVLRGGALGDFLVTLPALAWMRQQWPQARIELAGNATAAALGVHAGLIDAVASQHDREWAALHADAGLPAELAARLAVFDLVINYWPDPDGTLSRHFPIHPAQTFIPASARPVHAPAAAHYCEPLRALGLNSTNFARLLARPEPRSSWIALHPGSGSPAKNWPLASWRNLAAWLKQAYAARLFIISGDAEPDGLLAETGEPWRCLPLTQLLGQLAQCRLFIGHDSGISHLAAAAGTPCLLLFGPTDPGIWAPPYPQVRVVQSGRTMAAISESTVRAAVAAMLPDQK